MLGAAGGSASILFVPVPSARAETLSAVTGAAPQASPASDATQSEQASDRVAEFGASLRDRWGAATNDAGDTPTAAVPAPAPRPALAEANGPAPGDQIGALIEANVKPAGPPPAVAKPEAATGATPPLPAAKPDVKDKAEKAQLVPAKLLFGGAKTAAAPLGARSIGYYSRGCLSGGEALPIDGPAWQVMRLSRNRNWGHPKLIAALEQLAREAKEKDGWPGLLVGDISQARGGPMLTGHASHQIGLDADIWFTPMPDRRLSEKERETLSATSMISGPTSINREVFTDEHVLVVRRAALNPDVERILVHPAIKKAMCEATGPDRAWLAKVRPYYGHHYHFHVRMACPRGVEGCRAQAPVKAEDGCGKELDDWFALLTRPKTPPPPGYKPPPPKPPLTLADLPSECRVVINAGAGTVVRDEAELVRTSIEASHHIIDISGEKRSEPIPEVQAGDGATAANGDGPADDAASGQGQ
ncbi:MAG: penicillin-insensitive murein endopeptidase [Hyphomicrobiaceae bacterium]|nr:penicillin-insensitive murein endopeptidase [Hyphomicrobiaceae bacterium]